MYLPFYCLTNKQIILASRVEMGFWLSSLSVEVIYRNIIYLEKKYLNRRPGRPNLSQFYFANNTKTIDKETDSKKPVIIFFFFYFNNAFEN